MFPAGIIEEIAFAMQAQLQTVVRRDGTKACHPDLLNVPILLLCNRMPPVAQLENARFGIESGR